MRTIASFRSPSRKVAESATATWLLSGWPMEAPRPVFTAVAEQLHRATHDMRGATVSTDRPTPA